jgi:hypothetical protein
MAARGRSGALAVALLLIGCATRADHSQAYLAGKPVDLRELTPDEVASAVKITARDNDVFFQAPPIQTSKLVDLHRAGAELGISLGKVERVRFGYLFGVLDRTTNTMKHYVLFQSNFVTGDDRYSSVSLPDRHPLQFTVSRAPDPCVPNCFPVMEALIVSIPEPALRANQSTGLPLTITLSNGDTITTKGSPAYVQGYLQAVDRYRS